MAVAYRATTNTNQTTATTSFTVAAPTHAVGDLVLLSVIASVANVAVTGFTLQKTVAVGTDTHYLFWKIAGPSEPANYTGTLTSGKYAAVCATYSGVDTGTPFVGLTNNSGTNSTLPLPVITASRTGTLPVFFAARNYYANLTVPSGYLNMAQIGTSGNTMRLALVDDNATLASGAANAAANVTTAGSYAYNVYGFGLQPPPTNAYYKGGSTATSNSATSVTANYPNGTVSGDFLLAAVATGNSGNTITMPSGWTAIDNANSNGQLWYRYAGTETSVSITCSAAVPWSVALAAFGNVDPNTPYTDTGTAGNINADASGNWTVPGITTTGALEVAVALLAGAGTVNNPLTVGSPWTLGPASSSSMVSGIAYQNMASAAATGNAVFNMSGEMSGFGCEGVVLALNTAPQIVGPTGIASSEAFGSLTNIGMITLRSTPTTGTDYGYTGVLTANRPTGLVAGDLLLAAVTASGTVTPPTGWTPVGSAMALGGSGASLHAYSKVATASEPTSYTFNESGGYGQLIIAAYANTNGAVAQIASTSQASVGGASVSSYTPATVTTTLPNDLVVLLAGSYAQMGTLGSSYWQFDGHLDDANSTGTFIAEGQQAAAGTSSNAIVTTNSNNVGNMSSITVALEAAGNIDLNGQSIASAEALGTVGVQYDQSLTVTAIATLEAFGAVTLADDIAPTTIASAESFGTSPVAATYTVDATGDSIASAENFPAIYVESPNIDPAGIASAESFGTFSLSFDLFVAPAMLGSAEAFGTAGLQYDQTVDLSGEAIGSAEFIGTASVGAVQTIALRGAGQTVSSTGTTIAFNKPTGLAAGDVLLAFVSDYHNTSITAPSGWVQIGSTTTDTSNDGHTAWYKVAGASEPTSYTFTGGASYMVGSIIAYSGVDNNQPVNVWNTARGTTNFADAGITTTMNGCQLVAAMNDMLYATTFTPTSGWTNRASVDDTANNQSGVLSDMAQATAGASGSFTYTAASSGDADVVWMVALQPGMVENSFAIGPTQIASTEAFGSTNVAATITLDATGQAIATAESFGSPSVSTGAVANQTVNTPTAIASSETFGTISLSWDQALAPTAIASAETFGSDTVVSNDSIVPTAIATAQVFGTASIDAEAYITGPPAIASAEHFGSTSLTYPQPLTPTAIASNEAFGTAQLNLSIGAPTAISSSEAFGAVSILNVISLRGSPTSGGIKSTSLTVNCPTGVVNGDVLIAFATTETSTLTFPAGWAQAAPVIVDGSGYHYYAMYKVAANEPASYTLTASASDWIGCEILAYIGVDNANPINAAAGTYGSTPLASAAVTTTVANTRVIAALISQHATNFTASNGWTFEGTPFLDANNGLSIDPAAEALAAAGSSGTTTFSQNASQAVAIGIQTVALAPAATGLHLAPAGITSAEAFGSFSLNVDTSVAPTAIASSEAFGSPSVGEDSSITPTGLSSITLVNTQKQVADNGSNSSLTVTNPVGMAQGDLMLLSIFAANTAAPVTPSGWTLVQQSNSGFYTATYFKFAGASEPATWTFSNGTTAIYDYLISAYRGVDQNSPVHDVQTPATGGSGNPAIASFTTSVANGLVLAITGVGAQSTYTAPSGWHLDGNSRSDGEFNYGQQPSGTVVPATTFTDSVSAAWSAYAFTLQPAVAAAVPTAEGFGAVSVTQTATLQTVTASAIASSEAFGSVSVAASHSVAPSAIASTETFYNATIGTAGSLVPQPITSAESFGTAQVAPGGVAVSPTGIASSEAFGTAELDRSFSVAAIASSEHFGTASLTLYVTPTAIASAEHFGATTLGVSVNATGIASAESFGSTTVTAGTSALAPTAIASGEQFGSVQVSTHGGISPTAIASGEIVPSPVMGVGLLATGIASVEAVPAPSLATSASISPAAIASTETLPAPAVAFDVEVSSIASAEAFGAALVANAIGPLAIASAEAFGTAILSGINPINSNPVSDQTIVVQADTRTVTLAADPRTVALAAETRTVTVAAGTNLIY